MRDIDKIGVAKNEGVPNGSLLLSKKESGDNFLNVLLRLSRLMVQAIIK